MCLQVGSSRALSRGKGFFLSHEHWSILLCFQCFFAWQLNLGLKAELLLKLWHCRHRRTGPASFAALCNTFILAILIAITLKWQLSSWEMQSGGVMGQNLSGGYVCLLTPMTHSHWKMNCVGEKCNLLFFGVLHYWRWSLFSTVFIIMAYLV